METIIKILEERNLNVFGAGFKVEYLKEKGEYYDSLVLKGYVSERVIYEIVSYTRTTTNLQLMFLDGRLIVMDTRYV